MNVMANGLSVERVGRITGSRVAAVLGLNPYQKARDVLTEMVREAHGLPPLFQGNEATEWGKAHEPMALAAYERERGVMTYGGQSIILHPEHDFLAVTPDGLVDDDGMIECKAPFRGRYNTIAEVPYYLPQVQLQLACSGRAWCDFVVWREGQIWVDRVPADRDWLPGVLPMLSAFMAAYREAVANPDDYLADPERSDSAWKKAAAEYVAAREAEEAAKARMTAARDALLQLAGDRSAKGCGVQVIRAERAGSVAYAKAIKDLCPDADLTPYTGQPAIVYTVKECKQ